MREYLKQFTVLKKCYHFLMHTYNTFFITQRRISNQVFEYNKKRFFKYSGVFRNSKVKDLSYLTWLYHVIEKGLAMPNMRLGFGHDKIVELYHLINTDMKRYGISKSVTDAVSVLKEYKRVHENANYRLPSDIMEILEDISNTFADIKPMNQTEVTKEEYYSSINKDFKDFSMSRHSVRNFSGSVSLDDIKKAIDLAHYCPSACNRQPVRVHIVSDPKLKNECLKLQNGNRGFGYLADKLLIMTGDLSTVLGGQEFFDLGNQVGIFTMNLCYALHYYRIAHCVLNWYAMPSQDKQLRKLLNIPDEETIFSFIVCGDVPEKFKLVMSPRIPVEQIYTIH